MSLAAFPASVPLRQRVPWVLTLGIAAVVVAVAWGAYALLGSSAPPPMSNQFYRVLPIDMDVTITKEDAELQAVNNVDIISQVEGQNTIVDIVKEGSFVHKGDVICRLDSSDIENRLEQAQLDEQSSEADLSTSQENKDIQESTNAANLQGAQVNLQLAQLDLQEYQDGLYPASVQDAKTAVEMAQIEVKNQEDDLDQTRALYSKGFVTAVDVKTSEVNLLKAKSDLASKTTALDVLQKYTHEKDLTNMRNILAQADKSLARTRRENASNLQQREADLRSKTATLALRKRQLEHLQEQLGYCTIRAPQDGMVIYASSGSASWGHRDTPIQPGAQVRWQELIARLPDTASMKAVCKINEAQVSNLHVDPKNPLRATVQVVGMRQPLTAWLSHISIMADSSQRFWNADAKDYPVDLTLDQTPPGLKPGVSAKVTLFVERLHHVLAVPVSAVYAVGTDNYAFIRGADNSDPRPVKIALGEVNDTNAQLISGLSAGEDVLILGAGQGRDLLEKAGIHVESRATTQPWDIKRRAHQHERASAGGAAHGAATRPSSAVASAAD